MSIQGFNNIQPSCNTELEAFADSIFNLSVVNGKIAGASIIVYRKDELLLKKSYGYSSLELLSPMPDADDAIFEIGSVTKQFTAAAILKLVQEKRLGLDDDINQYLDFDTKGRTVTIRNLLSHSSGISNYTEIPEFYKLPVWETRRTVLLDILEQKEFLFEPGEALIYCNSGYFILGLIIEEITGQAYEDFLHDEFFEPLGMSNTYYSSTSGIIRNKVYGYNYLGDNLIQKSYLNHTWPYAAGSLCSSAGDLLTWMRAMHCGGLLPDSLYNSLIAPAKLNDSSCTRYAKGLVHYINYGHREISHGGEIPGFLSDTRYFPDEDLYIICLVNTIGPKTANYFADSILWQLLDKEHYECVNPDVEPGEIAGCYTGLTNRGI